MIEFFLTYKNLLLQALLSLSLTLFLVFLKIPIFFLHGLFTYIHPDNLSNGVKAAIRRPDTSDSTSKNNTELRKRNKSKDKFEFDENNAQIFRLKLDEAHLQSRLFSDDYRNAFTISFVAISCFLLHVYLSSSASEESGFGILVPVLLGSVAVFKLLILLAKLSFEKSASRRSEKLLCVVLGILGLILGSVTCCRFTSLVLDFDFGSIDGFGRMFIAVFMSCTSTILFMPSMKIARSFWLGTDQIRSNLSVMTCEWYGRFVLYANYLLMTLTGLLWIKPLSELLVINNNNTKNSIRNAERLAGNIGFSPSEFDKLRIWLLVLSGVLQLVALRPNLQMYLNEALLSWYQRLHASKVPDLDYSRAKVFLHNHYLCLVVIQFFAPPMLILLFVGFSQVDGHYFDNYQFMCSLLPCSAFVKEVGLFMAWWVVFVSSVYTSATIALFRCGNLYLS
ncbi:hypothetical protein G4B88_022851 [Cannabis sativa]|uniref:Transmembrane protein 161B n=1 Tax=Cannabis sativa TaxID=3483 RepID=A0A7J6HYG5_CANSA|nr:hypothetical protein G4B88_022851 [Cannabis sativa]